MPLTPTSPYNLSRPRFRGIRVYASDPSLAESLSTADVHEATLRIPWEADPDDPSRDGPAPGPVGEYIEVLDYDPASKTWYEPCDLNAPYLLAQDGHPPSDGNPQFHQQMVYAVAMKTIRHFEKAPGRRVLWAPRRYRKGVSDEEYVPRLRIYPHALREANAYYSPHKVALLFGYFKAPLSEDRRHMPGSLVFTCLSHDIIAETRSYKERIIEGVDLDKTFEVHSIRPSRRVDADGQVVTDVVMEITQSVVRSKDGRKIKFRGGATLIFDLESGRVRYCIRKDIDSARRLEQQFAYLRDRTGASVGLAVYADPEGEAKEGDVLALVHRTMEAPAGDLVEEE